MNNSMQGKLGEHNFKYFFDLHRIEENNRSNRYPHEHYSHNHGRLLLRWNDHRFLSSPVQHNTSPRIHCAQDGSGSNGEKIYTYQYCEFLHARRMLA